MSGMNPTIEWCEKSGGNCLRFTFGEMLTERDAEFAINKWKQAFNQKKDQCISLIWDCTDMKQYESAARKKWTNALFEMRPQIGSIWLPLPNLGGERILAYCNQWGINRLILTGGEDIGVSDIRDKTEFALLNWAEANDIPTLGICRGMQLMSVWAGSNLKLVENHISVRHLLNGEISGEVNSFHGFAPTKCPVSFKLLAKSEDGSIEAIRHEKKPMEGWMWHPERELPAQATDIQQLQRLFT